MFYIGTIFSACQGCYIEQELFEVPIDESVKGTGECQGDECQGDRCIDTW